jgi:NhaP-type Na+/H+ or K+/H+ antiporter
MSSIAASATRIASLAGRASAALVSTRADADPSAGQFLGWFGPRGLASILFVQLVVEEGRLAVGPHLEGVVILTVLLSAALHRATAYPFARRYGAYTMKLGPTEEFRESEGLPVRVSHAGT